MIATLSQKALALPASASFPECEGYKSNLTNSDVQILWEKGRFPGPYDDLGRFIDQLPKVSQTMIFGTKHNLCYLGPDIYQVEKSSFDAEAALSKLSKKVSALMAKDIEAQNSLVAVGKVCSQKYMELTKLGKTPDEIKTSDFAAESLEGVDPKNCSDFVKYFIPDLQARVKQMRILLALANPPLQKGKSLQHDKPFIDDIAQSFFPTIWKGQGGEVLPPLDDEEYKSAVYQSAKTAPPLAKKLYYNILSTSPMVLFFKQGVSAEQLVTSFDELQKQNRLDLNEFKINPPQDIMLKTPYVTLALQGIPKNQRGDACKIVDVVYDNLIRRYEKNPEALGRLMLAGAIAAAMITKVPTESLLAGIAKYTSVALTGNYAMMAATSIEKYSVGLTFCSTVAYGSSMYTTRPEACDLQGANAIYRDGVQSSLILSALGGASMLGVGRFTNLVGPALNRPDEKFSK
jgi:hypothetical protein